MKIRDCSDNLRLSREDKKRATQRVAPTGIYLLLNVLPFAKELALFSPLTGFHGIPDWIPN